MPVMRSLYEEMRGLGPKIEEYLSSIAKDTRIEGLSWIEVERGAPRELEVAGADASTHSAVRSGLLIYAAQGVGVRHGKEIRRSHGAAADFIEMVTRRSGRALVWDSVVSNHFRTLEVELAMKVSDGAEYVLFDGHYGPFATHGRRIAERKEDHERLAPPEFYRRLLERASELRARRLSLLRELAKRSRLIFISKTIRRAYLTMDKRVIVKRGDEEISPPDYLIVELVRRSETGFALSSDPCYSISKGLADIPERYTLIYASLSAGTLYQITIPGCDYSEGELREIVSDLIAASPGGYPKVLYEAHHLSLVKTKEFKDLVEMAFIKGRSGREALESALRLLGAGFEV